MEPEPMDIDKPRMPNLMDLSLIKSDMMMDMDTEVLDPVVFNQNFCRFVLTNKGFLHSFSRITFSFTNGDIGTLPSNVGIYSLIERCSLRIGTDEVSTFEGLNSYMGYKSMFIENSINKERETYMTSRIMDHDFIYNNNTAGTNYSNVNASGYGLCTDVEYAQDVAGTGGILNAQPEIRFENKSTFSVSIADLFPWLRFNQLPLYMLKDQVSIEMHFTPASGLARGIHNAIEASGTELLLNLNECQFVADYIYYDGNTMAEWQSQNSNLEWTYADYRLNRRTLTGEELNQNITIDIGGAGRVINKVVTALNHTLTPNDSRITNIFSAVAPPILNTNNQLFTTTLIYNDNRLYPIDRRNPALHFHDVTHAEDNLPHVSRQEFNNQGGAGGLFAPYTYMGYNQASVDAGLAGKFHYICYKLNRNERVNSRGIQLELQYGSFNNAHSFTHFAWLELTKRAVLNNGKFSCYLE